MLIATDLVKNFGAVRALDGFDLHIAAGEIAGLIGHNGAGKTTFVDVVTGLVRPDRGTVTVAGIDVRRHPRAARAHLGLAPQSIALLLPLTVRDNVGLFARLAGAPRSRRSGMVDDVIDELELSAVADRPVGVLSGGQQRRAQAATAMVGEPDLLLLDEPTVGADPDTRNALLAAIRRRAEHGAAVCYSTHYLPELVTLGATLAVAARGRLIARGGQDALLADLPASIRLTLSDGTQQDLRTSDPAAAITAVQADGGRLVDVVITPPTLDDLFRRLTTST